MFFRVEFECDTCGANILYEDDKPIVRVDRTQRIKNNKAQKFVHDHPLHYTPEEYNDLRQIIPTQVDYHQDAPGGSIYFRMCLYPEKYTPCPICDSRIYFA